MLTTEGTAFDSLTDTEMVPLAFTNGVYCLSYLLKPKEARDKYKTQKCLFHRLRCYTWKGPCNPFCAFSANYSRIQSAINLCEIQTFLKNNTGINVPVLDWLLPKCFPKSSFLIVNETQPVLSLLAHSGPSDQKKKKKSPLPPFSSYPPILLFFTARLWENIVSDCH